MKYLLIILFINGLAFSTPSTNDAALEDLFDKEIAYEVSEAISWVKPSLPKYKVWSYSKAIAYASEKYAVDPYTLIAIAQQESSFRENLPEGKAGEIGMLQIRKMWLKNKNFQRSFRGATISDLKTPEKAFIYAAWILNDLKKSARTHKLPYWTFYNSRKFKNRFTYYLRVKRHLSSIELTRLSRERVLLAQLSEWQPEPWRKINQMPQPEPFKILETIDWHKKAIEVLKKQKS